MSTPTAPALFPAPDQPRPKGGPYGCVPAIGSTRRLRALAADGWPIRTVARLTGATDRTLQSVRRGDRDWVSTRLAARIDDAYDVLGGRNPDQVLPATPNAVRAIGHTRALARRHRWPNVDDWVGVDMDDPAASPDDGTRRRYVDDRRRNCTAAELLDLIYGRADLPRRTAAWYRTPADEKRIVVNTLYERGLSVGEIGDLFGVHQRAAQRYRNAGTPNPRPAAPCSRAAISKATTGVAA